MNAITIKQYGDAEVLELNSLAQPVPAGKEVLVKVEVAGVNYIDIYHRTGLYPINFPFVPGWEGAGVVVEIGPEVAKDEFSLGDRVAWTAHAGSYAEYAAIPAAKLVKVPANLSLELAAGSLLQGLTAYIMTGKIYPVKAGDTVLVHAAAGGTGQLVVQMAKARGARIIGTVSSAEKAEVARQAGADETINYVTQDFEAEVYRITGGQGVAAVYDSIGQATFEKSLNSLQDLGYLVLYGYASGPIPPLDPRRLYATRPRYLTGLSTTSYVNNVPAYRAASAALFEMIAQGQLNIKLERTFQLGEAAEAHRTLESRGTTGKLLLIPR